MSLDTKMPSNANQISIEQSSGWFTKEITISPFKKDDDIFQKRKGIRSYSWLAAFLLNLFCFSKRITTYTDKDHRVYHINKKSLQDWFQRHGIARDETLNLNQETIFELLKKVVETNYFIKKLSVSDEAKQAIRWTADENKQNEKRWAYIDPSYFIQKDNQQASGLLHFETKSNPSATDVKHLFIAKDGTVSTESPEKNPEFQSIIEKNFRLDELEKIKSFHSNKWKQETHEYGIYVLTKNGEGKKEYLCVGYFGEKNYKAAHQHFIQFQSFYSRGKGWLETKVNHNKSASDSRSQFKESFWPNGQCPADQLTYENLFDIPESTLGEDISSTQTPTKAQIPHSFGTPAVKKPGKTPVSTPGKTPASTPGK